jgi:DUF4097 and DUF4098 domain-containing protein YvlB
MQFEPQQQRTSNSDPREQGYKSQDSFYAAQRIYPPRKSRRIGVILLVALLIVLVSAWSLVRSPIISAQNTLPTHTFTLSGHTTLVVRNDSGYVHIHSVNNTSTVVVQETEHAYGLFNDTQNAPVEFSQDSNMITISRSGNFSWLGGHSTDIDITVPNAIDVNVDDGSGDVEVADVNGSVMAKVGSGSVALTDITGPVNIKAGSGSLTLNNITGPTISADTDSGAIHAQNIRGQLTFSIGSGSINIDQGQISGNSTLKTDSGGINVNGSLDPSGSYIIKTGSGGVTLTLPTNSAFHLSASTGSGNVHNDFGNDSVGQLPQAPLSIQTDSGDITLHTIERREG